MWSWKDWLAFPHLACTGDSESSRMMCYPMHSAGWRQNLVSKSSWGCPLTITREDLSWATYFIPKLRWTLGNKGYWLNYFLGTVLVTLLNFYFLQKIKIRSKAEVDTAQWPFSWLRCTNLDFFFTLSKLIWNDLSKIFKKFVQYY